MSSTSVELVFNTYKPHLSKDHAPLTIADVKQAYETAVVHGGVWSDGQPALVLIAPDQPGLSFSMNVAPQLARPTLDAETLTADAALALLAHLQTTLFQMNLLSNAMRAQIDSLTQEINLVKQRDGNLQMMDNQIAARASGQIAGITGHLSTGLAVGGAIATVLLALVFGGIVAIAVAATAVVLAVLDTGSSIAQAAGAKGPTTYDGQTRPLDFSVSGLTQMTIDWEVKSGQTVIAEQRPDGTWVDHTGKTIADPTGQPFVHVMAPTEFSNYYSYTGMAISLVLCAGMIVGGFAAARMAGDLARFASNVSKLNSLLGTSMSTKFVQQAGNYMEGVTAAVQGGADAANGITNTVLALKNYELDKLNAALEHLTAQIAFMTQHMQLMQKLINEQAERYNDSVISTIRSIGQYHHAQTQIAHNVVQMG
jgi:hypothetical protein